MKKRRLSVIAIFTVNFLVFAWFQIMTFIESTEGDYRIGGIIATIMYLVLVIGLWYLPKIFRWISLVVSTVTSIVFGFSFYSTMDFLLNKEPFGSDVDGSVFVFNGVMLLSLNLSAFVLLVLPNRLIIKSNKKLEEATRKTRDSIERSAYKGTDA